MKTTASLNDEPARASLTPYQDLVAWSGDN